MPVENLAPTANASSTERFFTDDTGGGSAQVMLDGALSTDPDGVILDWIWSLVDDPDNPVILGMGETLEVALDVGEHKIELTVVDDGIVSKQDADRIDVTVFEQGSRYIGDFGSIKQWEKLEAMFAGPNSSVIANPNPFLIDVDVLFSGPGGVTQQVFGFYDGNGVGGTSGDKWKVRFSSGEVGEWTFRTSSTEDDLDNYVGSFRIVQGDNRQADFYRRGMLRYSGEHYLRFADGSHWVKSGIDDPENFLGDAVGDWQDKRDFVDYLASVDVNSIYMITNNVGGDRNSDTFPFWGADASEVRSGSNGMRYNVAKLNDWEDMFSYLQAKGLVLHIVLHDDSASVFRGHTNYYKEMVARFGHHPALVWNIGEEINEALPDADDQIDDAQNLRDLDSYAHPITLHHLVRNDEATFGHPDGHWPHYGTEPFEFASMHVGGGNLLFSVTVIEDLNKLMFDELEESRNQNRPIMASIDEHPRIDVDDSFPNVLAKARSDLFWPIYLAGGQLEIHYKDKWDPNRNDVLTPQDLDGFWRQMAIARQFVESLPFTDMVGSNNLLAGGAGRRLCFAEPGSAYGLYLSLGGEVALDLRAESGRYDITWVEPETGQEHAGGTIRGGDWRDLGAPPFAGDAAARIIKR